MVNWNKLNLLKMFPIKIFKIIYLITKINFLKIWTYQNYKMNLIINNKDCLKHNIKIVKNKFNKKDKELILKKLFWKVIFKEDQKNNYKKYKIKKVEVLSKIFQVLIEILV